MGKFKKKCSKCSKCWETFFFNNLEEFRSVQEVFKVFKYRCLLSQKKSERKKEEKKNEKSRIQTESYSSR